MTSLKILVVEDMVNTVSGAFELAALYLFNEPITFDIVKRSQDIDFEHINEYSLVFVDIELAKDSAEDGFAVIRRLINSYGYPLVHILILTGNTVIEEKLVENNISKQIAIVKKPVAYEDIANVLKQYIRLNADGTYIMLK